MRRFVAIACVLAALSLGSAPALAFQETPVPPPAANETPQAPPPAALQLGNPSGATAPQDDKGGLKLFGYTLLPKLNFGLDVLYGENQQQLDLQGPSTLDENGDITVLGKVKRRF